MAANKNKTAAWFVSHCATQARRELYVKKLKKHVDVDIYGKCGKLKESILFCSTVFTSCPLDTPLNRLKLMNYVEGHFFCQMALYVFSGQKREGCQTVIWSLA